MCLKLSMQWPRESDLFMVDFDEADRTFASGTNAFHKVGQRFASMLFWQVKRLVEKISWASSKIIKQGTRLRTAKDGPPGVSTPLTENFLPYLLSKS